MEILNLAVFGTRLLLISGESNAGSTREREPLPLWEASGSGIVMVVQTMARTHVPS